MNIEQLKYALEISKAKSINKAAESLYIPQPNLSRTIKNLEEELGFKIFERDRQGVNETIKGKEFLIHAAKIVEEVGMIDTISNPEKDNQTFSISVPKASYISRAFSNFIADLDKNSSFQIDFKECSAIGAIENILLHNFNLGIIRYSEEYDSLFNLFLREEGLVKREICEFTNVVAFSKNSELANKEIITIDDLYNYIELIHGDSYLPYINKQEVQDRKTSTNKVIRIYDSMGQLSMLRDIPNTFMGVCPLDDSVLDKYGLVQRKVVGYSKTFKDYFVFKKTYHYSSLDELFILELEKQIKK